MRNALENAILRFKRSESYSNTLRSPPLSYWTRKRTLRIWITTWVFYFLLDNGSNSRYSIGQSYEYLLLHLMRKYERFLFYWTRMWRFAFLLGEKVQLALLLDEESNSRYYWARKSNSRSYWSRSPTRVPIGRENPTRVPIGQEIPTRVPIGRAALSPPRVALVRTRSRSASVRLCPTP